ncbi:MAG: D-alanyl-D-alanine carboxypeptidase family protein [Beijerinckiaceae bacterium]
MLAYRIARAVAPVSFAAAVLAASAASAAPTLIVDANTGEVISSDEATRPWNPASTTKMMTAYVALKAVRSGRVGLETVMPVSRLAAGQRPSKLGLRPGSEITLDSALKVMLVKSANDLAVVVAEGVGGTLPNFINMMNAEAKNLGMRESYFMTPHGFHQPGQRTSARDLAVLARALYSEFPNQRDLWGIGAVQVGQRILKNTNGLIGRYPGAHGMKTGFVCASGFNLVGLASRGGRTLIAVVLGAGSGAERSVKTAQLLDQGFASWSSNGQTLANLPASGYDSAPDMRDEICRGGRNVALTDDDSGGAMTIASENMRSADSFNPVMEGLVRGGQGRTGLTTRTASGRVTLGPRAEFVPVQIPLGRTAGSATAPLAANVSGERPQPTAIAQTKPEKPEKPEKPDRKSAKEIAAAAPAKPAASPQPPAQAASYASTSAPPQASAGGASGIAALFAPFLPRSAQPQPQPQPQAQPVATSIPLYLQQSEPQQRPGAASQTKKPEAKKKVAAKPAEAQKAKPAAASE